MPSGYIPDSKVHGANMGPIWGRQDPGGPHVGLINFAIWDATVEPIYVCNHCFLADWWINVFRVVSGSGLPVYDTWAAFGGLGDTQNYNVDSGNYKSTLVDMWEYVTEVRYFCDMQVLHLDTYITHDRENGHHFAEDIFKCICRNLMQVSLEMFQSVN